MTRTFALIAVGAMLSGCMKLAPIETPPQQVTFASKSAASKPKELQQTEIRTVASSTPGKAADKEILGAKCRLQSEGYTANIVTPTYVMLPVYTGRSSPMTMTCQGDGSKVAKTYNQQNLTLQRIQQTQDTSGSVIGILVTAAAKGVIKSTRNPLKDEFGFGNSIALNMSNAQ